jgi:hypothetical protein
MSSLTSKDRASLCRFVLVSFHLLRQPPMPISPLRQPLASLPANRPTNGSPAIRFT